MVSRLPVQKISAAADIDEILDGGIPLGSLTLLEGETTAGKSVLAQHLTYGALSLGLSVAYYTTHSTIKDLTAQMVSLALDATDYFLCDRLRIYPLRFTAVADPAATFLRLLDHFQSLPAEYRLLVLDAVSDLIAQSDQRQAADFFAAAGQLAQQGRTIVVAVHPDAAGEAVLDRVRSLCDTHLAVRLEQQNNRPVRVLEVVKLAGAAPPSLQVLGFSIEPGQGIKALSPAGTR